ncbi:MAG: response regulator [Chrysiogenales bacterium]
MKQKQIDEMNEKKNGSENESTLRQRAEEKANFEETRTKKSLSPEETSRTLYEMRVHRIELEMQNEELRRAQAELETARALYFDLYDLAPVGYVTISQKGLILEANLSAAALLGVARGALTNRLLSRFILKEDQDIYYRHYKQLFASGAQQVCELRMMKQDGSSFWARLEAATRQAAGDAPVCRVVVSDITAHHIIEEAFRRKAQGLQEKNENLSRYTHAVASDRQSLPVRNQEVPVAIMLLEDDPAHAEAVKRAFLDVGMKAVVHWSQNLGDYQALAAAHKPDIAIVDLHLPDGNAVHVLTAPAEAGPFPILILTGHGDERVAVEAMKAGAIDYIEKSAAAFAAIPRSVERALREWDLLQAR